VFEGLGRLEVASKPNQVKEKVKTALDALDRRMALFRQANARDIDQYNKKYAGLKPTVDRIVFIVDEFSELIPKLNSGDRKILTEINQGLLRIARMGRACGIHLVIGIQKPDNNNIDPGIKANLPGIVCFPVTHFTQSMLILGDGRAADLPAEVKGRAIWKYGIEQIEVQTPYVSEAEIEALRKSLSRKEEKAHEDTKDAEAADIQREADFKISLEMESREHDDDQNVPGS
jgi:S-DNA-T family DNA segregation ATPase FtsK/SpoIIIE